MQDLVSARPEEVGLSSARLAHVEAWAQRLVDEGKLPGVLTLVARRGRVAHLHVCGQADLARGVPLGADTIFRIYSMTKPLTSVALMMLYEEGRFQLDDPVARFLPCFANMRVFTGGSRFKFDTAPAERDITIRDLLTHTAGLTYGFIDAHPVDAMYREQGVDFQTSMDTLAEVVERAARLPLIAQPGRAWNYSIASDVLGHLIAVISGQSFEAFLQERVLGPLGMDDTGFHVPAGKLSRFAALYTPGPEGLRLMDDPQQSIFAVQRPIASGGGGLVSTVADYLTFCRLMLNEGELDGVRLLGRKTMELMTSNHLGGDMADLGTPRFSESTYAGIGFGLGFSVMLDPAKAQIVGTPGEYAWGGAASTSFWIDPQEDMAVILLTQLFPSSTYPIRRELRVLTYAAITD
ncbi:Beta-lactamase class C and other penicillin binding proteins [Rhodovastum atsumiense]|uniref:Beta-lactamase family protein n=1 Tax=Rhodovastum atsumiense TaxID=504468 RepID=A0A5M6IMZ0_9PROT|nr:serine hydrolase domain-containing protein [Rhodovastum atsumiense]KAA5608918.1 beta-lactamase family protein [Rhodovastum atsumiense]CAH2604229.1 Beta-lactamase class C and other penicillin binding proteins [Rhodovastum atsumiense]